MRLPSIAIDGRYTAREVANYILDISIWIFRYTLRQLTLYAVPSSVEKVVYLFYSRDACPTLTIAFRRALRRAAFA
jgi:hypothetical protein